MSKNRSNTGWEGDFASPNELIGEIRRLHERLSRLMQRDLPNVNGQAAVLAERFMACVKKNVSGMEISEEARFVTFYARQLCVHPNHLSAVVKRETGKAALAYIHSQILEEAKLLLVVSKMSVKQIAYRLAFKEPSHFNAFFRKHADCTPAMFRVNAAGNHWHKATGQTGLMGESPVDAQLFHF